MKKLKILVSLALAVTSVASLAACQKNEEVLSENYDFDESSNSYESSVVFSSETKSEISELSKSSEKVLDPFEKLKITYTGTSPYIVVSTDNSSCDSIIKENFNYQIEDKKYKNGDSFEVTAVYDSYSIETLGYSVLNNKKSYTIKDCPEFITNIDGLDLSEMQSEINDKLTVVTAAKEGDNFFAGFPLDWISGYKFNSYENKGLKSAYLISLKSDFEDKYSNDAYNKLMLVYDYNVTSKKYEDDVRKEKRYVMIIVNNISLDCNATINWDVNIDYKSSDNYDSLIIDEVTSQKEYYNVTELSTTKDTWGVPQISN
ncbi:hypothetical protein [Pseudoruminococcus massiliensis]|uniref:hypothetical protein n=1 Tax=Pseudoruminococcus massiliensis TaxID=2086583 RepID=UPI000D0FBE74|nr:hypothetical protein [Pseudoruminococcus massiliensis]